MVDAMNSAPGRIWLQVDVMEAYLNDGDGDVEYIRADLYAARIANLEASNRGLVRLNEATEARAEAAEAQAGALLDQAAKKAFNAIAKFPLRTMVTNTDNATMLELAILSIAPDATAALERALVKAREEEQGRVVRIAAGLFPGGYDNNAARILAALKPLGGDA